jgi:putative transposase
MDNERLLSALRYVEQNPLRSGLVGDAWRYPWSSAGAHVGQPDPSGVLDLQTWQNLSVGTDWHTFLSERVKAEDYIELRRQTATGRPLGTDTFLSALGAKLGREMRGRPVGRPPDK